ncbi:WD40-repeat-containing domain protein [Phlyctochytrium arcticum]|nr:WD40-repeat-containing domain protein [Phlyctochytrium arcticum]
MAAGGATITFDTQHEDLIHDAQVDYYGKRLATCSSDRTIKIYEIEGDSQRLIETLRGHEGPVWQVSWAHPKFGNVLASCSYDSKVCVWKETNGRWVRVREDKTHSASVNSVAWAPHEFGLILGAASSDGKVSIHTCKEDGAWDVAVFSAHSIGCNAITWSPSTLPGSLIQQTGAAPPNLVKRFASAGCDNLIKIWREENGQWKEDTTLEGHTDWVRDIAWAPNLGLPSTYLASCSQDKTVFIWTQEDVKSHWSKRPLRAEPFPDVIWRVSWSTSGNILAVSCGDNKITLWKENLDGEWGLIGGPENGESGPPQ